MKVDSGANMCCISAENHRILFAQGCAGTLCQTDWPFHGPDGKRFDVSDSLSATFEYKGRRVDITTYILVNVAIPLLNRLAGIQLGIIVRLETIRFKAGDNRPIF